MGVAATVVSAVTAITTAIGGAVGSGAVALGIGAATAEAIGAVAGPAIFGAAIGAGGAAITGGNPLVGALTGGLTGGLGAAGVGEALGGALGVGTGAGNALVGAGVGALGSGLSGGNPLTGALVGGVGGYLSNAGALGNGEGQGVVDSFYGGGPQASLDVNGNPIMVNGALSPPTPPQLDASGNPVVLNGVTQYGDGSQAAWDAANPPALNAQSQQATKGSDSSSGLGKILSTPGLLTGALSAASSLFSKPQQGNYPIPNINDPNVKANLGPLYSAPLNTSFPGRTQVTPNVPNYYTYGSMPGGATYFNNNSLAAYGFARGGALSAANDDEFDTDTHGNYVRGPGGPTGDKIPAMLSDGEYVLDHADVTRIGGGSNARGARILDRKRRQLDHGGGALAGLARAS